MGVSASEFEPFGFRPKEGLESVLELSRAVRTSMETPVIRHTAHSKNARLLKKLRSGGKSGVKVMYTSTGSAAN